MSEDQQQPGSGEQARKDARRDLAEHERPDVGLVADEDLPEDVRPSDDNPLAKDPDDDAPPGAGPAPGGGPAAPGPGGSPAAPGPGGPPG